MSNVLEFKEFIGSVSYSGEDELFHGKIEGIEDLVTFEGRSVEELKTAFHEAVEDYLEICKSVGKDPEKTYKGTFNVRVKPEIHRAAARTATRYGYSMNQLVEKALEDYLVKEPKADYPKSKKNKPPKQ